MTDLPFSAPCERNKEVILEQLRRFIPDSNARLFEIGSLTCQHAEHFAKNLPDLEYTTSEIRANQEILKKCLKHYQDQSPLKNLKGPEIYEAGFNKIPAGYNLYFTANSFHIMSWKECKTAMKDLASIMEEGSTLLIYGPFKYQDKFTSESNEKFDKWLKERDPKSGVRSFEDICNNFLKKEVFLLEDIKMPANNQLLIFQK